MDRVAFEFESIMPNGMGRECMDSIKRHGRFIRLEDRWIKDVATANLCKSMMQVDWIGWLPTVRKKAI